MEETGDHWAPHLNAVLQLIKSKPEKIVDDTSLEKLLTHLKDTVKDEAGRTALLKLETGVLEFLSAPPKSLFSNTVSGNFALRLAGMLGGSTTETCELLVENRSLQNLFGYLAKDKNDAIKNAALRYSFYEGLRMLLENAHGYKWVMAQGYITNAIHAFNDASFYVTKSAVEFLARLLFSANRFDNSQNNNGENIIMKALLSEYLMCDQTRLCYYADLITLVLSNVPEQGFEILRQFGGIHAMLTSKPGKNNSALLQAVSGVCCGVVITERPLGCYGSLFYDGRNDSSQKMELADFLLNICVDIANADIIHFIPHITRILSKDIPFPANIPSYWNELLIHLIIRSVLHSQMEDVPKTSYWLKKKFQVSKEYPFPEDILNLLGELEKIIECKTIDTAIWKKFFSTSLDNSKAFFTKELEINSSPDTKQLIERLSLFLCDVMLIGIDVDQETSSDMNTMSISTSQARRSFIGKCIGTQILLVSNGWFKDFTMKAKLKLCKSIVILLKDLSLSAQTLTSCIQLVSSLIAVMTSALASAIFRTSNTFNDNPTVAADDEVYCLSKKLALAFENLIVDSRWEVQDSLLDMVVKMIDKAEDFNALKAFLTHHTFWMKAWQLLDADESYIRASSVRVIGIILEKDELREILVQDVSLETVLAKLLEILRHDDEAFPKRSVMEVILRYICKVPDIIFHKNNSENVSTGEVTFEEKLTQMIFKSLIIAAEDFDWEVKLKGIQCWCKLINARLDIVKQTDEELNTGERQNSTNLYNPVKLKDPKRSDSLEVCIQMLCKTGGSKILFNAVNDCDQLVREAACNTLGCIRQSMDVRPNFIQMPGAKITSCYDLESLIADINFSEEKDFVEMLMRIDCEAIAETLTLADDHVANNSISLLKDIIAAAQHSDDNLLDCY